MVRLRIQFDVNVLKHAETPAWFLNEKAGGNVQPSKDKLSLSCLKNCLKLSGFR